jgi:signal transduction histidine kinase
MPPLNTVIIFSIPCPLHLFTNFQLFTRSILRYPRFLFHCALSPRSSFQPNNFHNEKGTALALIPLIVHISASPDPAKILIIDDEIGPRESLRMLLKPSYQVHTAENVETGLQLLQEKRPDTIVMDIRMPGMNGIDGLRKIREIDPHLSVIMFTGFGALETAQEALRLGANDYINKPFDAVQMREVIGRNVERTRLQRQSEATAHELQELNERLRNELAQKERLASLGQASAEFVHDLSNPLTIVWGYVQILAKKLEQSGDGNNGLRPASSPRELQIIEQNVRLCRELLTMWQSYGKVGAAKTKPISIGSIVQDVGKSVSGMASQNGVQLDCHIADEECIILGDPIQLTRAIQNVIVNAIQAATDKRGKVVVNCREKDLYADIQVRDTGYGIAENEIGKIFDPYFTTKQGKNGTGLGLYITKKVVDDHNGSIDVKSTLGEGTTFTLRLPLHDR